MLFLVASVLLETAKGVKQSFSGRGLVFGGDLGERKIIEFEFDGSGEWFVEGLPAVLDKFFLVEGA